MIRTRVPSACCAVAVVLAAALLPGAAQARPPAKGGSYVSVGHRSAEYATSIGSTATAIASCPEGTIALGGGWSWDGAWLNVTESLRQGTRKWRVSGSVVKEAPIPSRLTAQVYCRHGRAPQVRSRVHSLVLRADGVPESGVAACPRGRIAVAGGFSAELPPGAYVNGTFRTAHRRWATEVASPSAIAGATARVRTLAYCVPGRNPKTKAASKVSALSGDSLVNVAASGCGYLAASGGFRINGAPPAVGDLRVVNRSMRGGPTAWGMTLFSEGTYTVETRSFAYCVKR